MLFSEELESSLVVGLGGVVLVCVVWVEVEGFIGSQSQLSVLSTISSRVALVNVSVPLEDNPPALGVQYFTVSRSSVMMMLPV